MLKECWESIEDMPLYNWVQVTEEGKMEYVCKDIAKADKVDLQLAWERIYDDYLHRFGLSKFYKRLLEVKKKKVLLELEYVITRDRFHLTLIEVEERSIEQMLNNRGAGVGISAALVYLSKWVGYRLNWKELTTLEYFNIMDLYGKENKQQRSTRK